MSSNPNVVIQALVKEMNDFLIMMQEQEDKEAKEIIAQGFPQEEVDDLIERIFG
jgi:hypothetical protein